MTLGHYMLTDTRDNHLSAFQSVLNEILGHVSELANKINRSQVNAMLNTILEAKKVFVIGAGRSGLVAKAFAMRLMHLGYEVFVIGESTTPPIFGRDVLISISGSGETDYVKLIAQTAKKRKAVVVGITSYPESSLGKLADILVELPGRTELVGGTDYIERQLEGFHEPLSPLGTIFELTSLLFLDAFIVELMQELGVTEKYLRRRHANLE